MATKMRVLALTLWVVTLACFAVGWLYTNRIASGCTIQSIRLTTSRRPCLPQLDDVEREARRALVYPSRRAPAEAPSPLVIYFHGYGGDIYDSATLCRFHTLWPEAVVA